MYLYACWCSLSLCSPYIYYDTFMYSYMYCVCDQGGQPAAMMQQCLVHANGEPITFAADIIVPMRVSTNKKKVKAVHVTVQSAGRCTD